MMLLIHKIMWRRRFSSWITNASKDPKSNLDVEALFLDRRVQELLTKVTGVSPAKMFRFRQYSGQPQRPAYRLMTQEEFDEAQIHVLERAKQRLQIPPIKEARADETKIIAKDPEIACVENAKMVFYDISPGLNHRERLTVVRENDGTLRTGTGDERDRMRRTYFPESERPVLEPQLFVEPNLTETLKSGKYEFVLDYAAWYFEPDDPKYIKVVSNTYDHCDKTSLHESLWSTRHYGAFVFYLVLNKRIDNLLVTLLNKRKLMESADVIRLYRLCHKDCQTEEGKSDLELVKNFAKSDSRDRPLLENVIQAFQEATQRELQPVADDKVVGLKMS